ncbi:xanthine/uracil permease family transport protein [Natrialba magadii ATCC 43099]|uniref:Xanthine/uracil permease family transport protein n=1 Tax=Natrialba magadii (strain ATCC 43099 / DSM 3394 / CCM 3739 / CIP 104546 / IAM 13178 / JCM 8861 / NBRC 102185 / NCIMB 2190 / MS3) TaxID=547559 RepID=D3SS32_NATMM|nr:NCS2 family permease [Natrialba magadii]ADD04758.1 xanthine/uracil permease family transport protein [Natrialba magadii ATCC 43099]ELY24925.1 xanthine/uracil/vitamin C permease [Natrialba magadii ATCC 43099]
MGVTETIADYFGFDEYDTSLSTEAVAGLTTFLAMSYIIIVNPTILSSAIQIDGYTDTQTFQMIAVATILASIVATIVMAFWADRPFGLAPGMGLNAFFAFTVVIGLGVPWEVALAAVFVEGIIFIALTAVGARRYIIELFPEPVKFAVGAGIGVFLLFLGLQEIELVVADDATLVYLGNVATSPVAALSLVGLVLTFVLYARGVRGGIVLGILFTAISGWLLTLLGFVAPGELAPEDEYNQITNEGLSGIIDMITSVQYDFTPLIYGFVDGLGMITEEPLVFALVVFTFFFVDFFDTAGTLIGVSQIGGFLNEDGNLPEMERPLMADAVGTTVGAMIGTSTVTTFIESSAGLEEGGRTGFTALVVAGLFTLSLLFVPLMGAIPQYATYIALVVVGIIMLQGVADIDWNDPAWLISSGLTITIMPLTASIANGLAAGIMSYPLIKAAVGERADVSLGQWALVVAFIIYYIAYFATDAGMLAF